MLKNGEVLLNAWLACLLRCSLVKLIVPAIVMLLVFIYSVMTMSLELANFHTSFKEEDWEPKEGGSLELYGPQNDTEESSPIPVARVWLNSNTMAFFTVQPGYSFPAVQEVLGDRPRLSLQGWYHASEAPENSELATLQQLKQFIADSEAVVKLEQQFDENQEFSEEDKQCLSKYLQAVYLTEETTNEGSKEI
jgi:hypothetical protein